VSQPPWLSNDDDSFGFFALRTDNMNTDLAV
jgi:hypothetical protein